MTYLWKLHTKKDNKDLGTEQSKPGTKYTEGANDKRDVGEAFSKLGLGVNQ